MSRKLAQSLLVLLAGMAVCAAFLAGYGMARAHYDPYIPAEDSYGTQYQDHHVTVVPVVP